MKEWPLLIAIGCAVPGLGTSQLSGTLVAHPPCQFLVAPAQSAPTVLAEESLLPRIHVMRQREAPLAIVHADLRKMVLDSSRHYFSITGSYSIQVKNVSNVALIDVDVRLITGTSAGSVGGGLKLKSPLSPGAVATLTDRFVNGQGTMIGDEEPALHIFIESVRTSDCVYHPAKVWASVPK